MNEPTIESLTRRLAELEAHTLRVKRRDAVVLIGFLALFLMGHGEPAAKLVEADQIALRAPGGTIRGELSLQGDGGARLVLYDPGRTPRVELASQAPDGSPTLTLYDKRWTPRVSLRLDDDGTPRFEFYDRAGKTIWKAP